MLGLTQVARQSRFGSAYANPCARPHLKSIRTFVDAAFGGDLYAKRTLSLANSAADILHAFSLAVHAIGQAYAQLTGSQVKHSPKQVDHFLTNGAVRPWDLIDSWARFVLGTRIEIVVAFDGTDFEKGTTTTQCAYLVTRHGSATPIAWKTVPKSILEGKRTGYEHKLVERLHAAIPPEVCVVLLVDRGFGDQRLYALFGALELNDVIRFRDGILTAGRSSLRCRSKFRRAR